MPPVAPFLGTHGPTLEDREHQSLVGSLVLKQGLRSMRLAIMQSGSTPNPSKVTVLVVAQQGKDLLMCLVAK